VDPKLAIGESIGIEKFSKELVDDLFLILDQMITKEKDVNVFYEKAFQRAIEQGAAIFPINVGDYKCMETDTIEDYEQAQKMMSEL
jgi:choline kinase